MAKTEHLRNLYETKMFSFTLAETLWHNECMRTVVAKTKSWKRLSENLYKFSGCRRIHAKRIKMARNRCELCVKSNFFFQIEKLLAVYTLTETTKQI